MKDLTPDQLLDLVRERSAAAGSQQTLAQRLQISGAYLSDVLHGRREVSDNLAAKLGFQRTVIFRPLPKTKS